MKSIEIPYVKNRGRRYRFFEMLPGLLSWSLLALPFVLSYFHVELASGVVVPWAAIFVPAYLLLWFVKAMGLNVRSVQGFRTLHQHEKLPWTQLLEELRTGKVEQPDRQIPTWHYENIKRIQEEPTPIKVDDVIHAIIIATYNEAREVLEPTIQSVIASEYDMKKVILVLAYEERGGPDVEANAQALMADYNATFKHAFAVKHPSDIPGEVIGKGGNITFAARELEKYLAKEEIDPLSVIVTTLDSDNRPHKHYLNALTYLYAITPEPLYVSYQPIPMFTNNIWDAPAPMRVIATGNSFWNVVLSIRPHMIRNFSSHAQSMQALIDTEYWSVRTIVEDGHQFWRTYFRYDGKHEVYPIYLPIYQDAVLSTTYWKTLKAQFIQLRRWAWGASDVAFVVEKGYFTNNRVPKLDLTFKFLRLLEGHVSWATAPLILAFAAFIPQLFDPQDIAANQLPHIASRIQTIALGGIFITLFLSLKLLPPKPKRYKKHRYIGMVLQFILLPVTTILFNAFAALVSQTRLIFGRYLGKFDVTDKAVVTEDNTKVI
jgi:cellulose synthase/poly-beta-1,6-N-acetylglucosamine synthase-like glycosyltransferase